MLATSDSALPKVMSISYAWSEQDQCDISPGVAPCNGLPVPAGSAAFVKACNALFAKIGARGISLISASGDSGAHGRTDPGCTSPATRPDYPAASPFLTAVGATELAGGTTGPLKAPICKSTLTCATGGTEVVASNKLISFFSSGGGFSTQTAMPAWQSKVVKAYIASSPIYPLPPASATNYSNRGFPDVSALGHHYYVELGGQIQAVDGTSAATPVFSGLIASLNGWRVANGKPVLGWLNPLLYALYDKDPTTFNDVLTGDNSCTESACPCPAKTGFGATAGWDAATGLGTPNYDKIKATSECGSSPPPEFKLPRARRARAHTPNRAHNHPPPQSRRWASKRGFSLPRVRVLVFSVYVCVCVCVCVGLVGYARERGGRDTDAATGALAAEWVEEAK